jgi:hypothetical protein
LVQVNRLSLTPRRLVVFNDLVDFNLLVFNLLVFNLVDFNLVDFNP